MQLALGAFIFETDNLTYSQLGRRTAWRHAGQSRVGASEALQYVGPGDDTLSLTGVLPHGVVGRSEAIATLRDMGRRGAAWPLVGGDGVVHGAWIITDLDETQRGLMIDGRPRLSDFTLNLKAVDADALDDADPAGSLPAALDLGRLVGIY